ncbi:MAG: hypothetical protein QOF89_3281 [Acidobacteriota bacterium]|jgi:hypothetical protein|nr:hypothetical protein [Acidobacteriota bacterium]
MNSAIREGVQKRGITRLCHFTPSRNLVHITTDPNGLLASARLKDDEKTVFNATDRTRLDGFPDHVCCSIQYPNAWYFRKARDNESLFADWVVLLLKPDHLWAPGTKFCPRNAAASYGSGVAEGERAFESMFAASVTGAYNKTYTRLTTHPTWLPTDEQAEVLIPDRVAREDVLGVAVADESQAKREHARLTQLLVEAPPIVIAPDFFQPSRLSAKLRAGRVPAETLF